MAKKTLLAGITTLLKRPYDILNFCLVRLNVLHVELMEEVYDALESADKDDSVQAVIITGVGKAFCAGADVKELMPVDLERGIRWLQAYWRVFDLLRETGKPVIAVVKGYCVAGGNEWVLACDLVVAGKSAVFGQPEPIIVSTAFLAVLFLPIVVGERRAREMLLTGKLISADEAHRIGLVNKVVPDEQVEEEARKLAIEILVIDRVNPPSLQDSQVGARTSTASTWPLADEAFNGLAELVEQALVLATNKIVEFVTPPCHDSRSRPCLTGEVNICPRCYGCREATDVRPAHVHGDSGKANA